LSGLSITGVSAARGRFQLGGVPGAFGNHARVRPRALDGNCRRRRASPEGASCLLLPPPPLLSARRLASRVRQVIARAVRRV